MRRGLRVHVLGIYQGSVSIELDAEFEKPKPIYVDLAPDNEKHKLLNPHLNNHVRMLIPRPEDESIRTR